MQTFSVNWLTPPDSTAIRKMGDVHSCLRAYRALS